MKWFARYPPARALSLAEGLEIAAGAGARQRQLCYRISEPRTPCIVTNTTARHHFFRSSTTAHTANNSTHATPSTTATHVKPFTAAIMAAASKRRCRKRKQYIKAFTSDHIPIPDYDNHTRPVRCVCPPTRRGSISIIPIYFDMAITANRLSADS